MNVDRQNRTVRSSSVMLGAGYCLGKIIFGQARPGYPPTDLQLSTLDLTKRSTEQARHRSDRQIDKPTNHKTNQR